MAYKALYRTYRPRTFDEVSGQTHIVKTLKNALASGKIAHAYLFCGPRGTGKTTMAKLMAEALNCEEGIGHQCLNCKNCQAIIDGTHPDVIEIDAASNNGVEEVRDLIDKVRYSTILGRYKVYIIDEVHMMTPGAFNALLKTLEEPPANVVFILATTEPHKILPTILSRCQRYDFSMLTDDEIRNRLKQVLEAEHITYEKEAVDLIISLADGGMRDALSILDQVLAYSDNVLNAKDVLEIFSLESKEEKVNLVKSIFQGEVADVLLREKNYITKGTDIKRLTNDLLMMLKDLLIYSNTYSKDLLTALDEQDARSLLGMIKPDKIIKHVDLLMEAIKDYRSVTSIAPLFEVTLLKMATIGEKVKVNIAPSKRIEDEPKSYVSDDTSTVLPTSTKTGVDLIPEEEKIAVEPKAKIIPAPVVEDSKPDVEEEPSLFAFEEIDESKITKGVILPESAIKEEESYKLSEELIIDIMTTAKKDIKNRLLKDWDKLLAVETNPKYGAKAMLIHDGHPLVATKESMIVEYDLTSKVSKVNLVAAQEELQAITQIIFGRKMFVYALGRKDSVAMQQKFINLKVVGKLPKADTVEIKWIGE